MIDKLVEIGILFDFYGRLLSDRQYGAIELYYIHDLSLAEIGEELGISRQGVYDTLKRAEQKLYEYEDILGLIKKFKNNRDKIMKIAEVAVKIEQEAKNIDNQKIIEEAEYIKNLVKKIIEDS
jgi:predicted DNA-binding protein YlxM (UPF0122 family)